MIGPAGHHRTGGAIKAAAVPSRCHEVLASSHAHDEPASRETPKPTAGPAISTSTVLYYYYYTLFLSPILFPFIS